MGIVAAYAIADDMVQINEEIAPGTMVTRLVVAGDDDYLAAQALAMAFASGEVQPHLEFADAPHKAFPFLEWDPVARDWFDPRSPAEIEAELAAWRASASMSKVEFGQRCVAAGLLHHDDFAPAMRGQIPVSFEAVISTMPPEMQDMVPGIWAGSTRIERLDPFIVAIAYAIGLDDEALDILFSRMPGFDPL